MDARRARESLDEIRDRRRQVEETVTRQGSPWWYVGGIGAVFLAVSVSLDLEDLLEPQWIRQVSRYAVLLAGVLAIGLLARALHRGMGLRAQRSSSRVTAYLAGLTIGVLVVDIGPGTVLRLYDVAWDSTLSGLAATVLLVLGLRATRLLASRRPVLG